MKPSFLRAQHPKSTLMPRIDAFEMMIAAGMVGQRKVHGHRAQVHIGSDGDVVAFTRQGTVHTSKLPGALIEHLADHYRPTEGWMVLDGEWQKQEGRLYLFDLIRLDRAPPLDHLGFVARHTALTTRFVIGPHLSLLPILRTVEACWAMIQDPSEYTEGLVFRSPDRAGFHDTSIARCRKSGAVFEPFRKKGKS